MSGVRGPNSALTEFLRAQGISATEIRRRHERRVRGEEVRRDHNEATEQAAAEIAEEAVATAPASIRAADDPEVAAIAAAAARKRRGDEDEAANEGTAICANCHSRFTLTVYTREAPGIPGGFLCRNCTQHTKKRTTQAATKEKTAKRQRKKLAADLLDLRASVPPSLQDLCISRVAEYIDDIDELGDITVTSFARIARILTKNRRLSPRTVQLFLRRDVTTLELWDCSQLTAESYNIIPTLCPNLQKLTLGMCGQLTGDNLVNLATQLPHLEEVHLDGPFLVRKTAWLDFFDLIGPRLRALTIKSVYRVDAEVLAVLIEVARDSLQYLSLHRLCEMCDDAPLQMLGGLSKLEHLELVDLEPEAWTDAGLRVSLNLVGSQLRELIIGGAENHLSDATIDAIAASCGSLSHLELNNLTAVTEDAMVGLFAKWIEMDSNHGLTSLSLERCINFGDEVLALALEHSGASLVDLNINSLRRLTPTSIEALARLPHLTRLDIGFVGCIDPVHIYKLSTSKTLAQIKAYGNIRLSGMPLPTGLTVVGTM